MEIMCLRTACKYNPDSQTLTLQNGLTFAKHQIKQGGLGLLVEPIFEFAIGLSKLALDETEIALLAAVLLMQSGKNAFPVFSITFLLHFRLFLQPVVDFPLLI